MSVSGWVIGLRDPRRADRPDVRAASAGGRRGHLVAGGPGFLVFGLFREIFAAMKSKASALSMGIGLFQASVNIVRHYAVRPRRSYSLCS